MTRILFILLACLLPSAMAFGQPGPPPDPDIPISGIELLIGAGAAYGISRKWLRKKQPKG